MVVAAFKGTVQPAVAVGLPWVQEPVQPVKVELVLGVSDRMTWVPAGNDALQTLLVLLAEPLLVQLMPLGELTTWPKPELLLTLSV
jgi:hypothetical protein